MRNDELCDGARRRLITAGGALLATGVPGRARADTWPSRPVRIVVPYAPGGATDVHARMVAPRLAETLGQPFVVENRAGAGGTIGTDQVAKAAPDGYTLLAGGVGTHTINPHLYRKLPFDALADFAPVALIGTQPNVLCSHPSFPAQRLQELVAHARRRPGALSYASPGSGTSNHLAMEMLKSAAGLFIVHIPYRGGGPALTDVLGGVVPLLFINVDVALPHVRAGRLRAYAVSTLERSPVLPEVPTVAESGFPGFQATSWTALYAPARTPAEIVGRLHRETLAALQRPEVSERLRSGGFQPSRLDRDAFARFQKAEFDRWGEAVRRSGATVD